MPLKLGGRIIYFACVASMTVAQNAKRANETNYLERIAELKKTGTPIEMATALGNLGAFYLSGARYAEAERAY